MGSTAVPNIVRDEIRLLRIYAVARTALSGLVFLVYLLGGLDARQGVATWIIPLVVVVFCCGSVAVFVGFQVSLDLLKRTVWAILPVDLFTWCTLVYATRLTDDPYYPMLIGIAIYYAMLAVRRDAWSVGLFVGVAYLVAHALRDPLGEFEVGSIVIFTLKAAVLPAIGFLVGNYTVRLRKQQLGLSESFESIEGLNTELSYRLSELHAVSDISDIIHSSLDFDAIGPRALEVLQKVIDVPACGLMVLDAAKDETLFHASVGEDISTSMRGRLPTAGIGLVGEAPSGDEALYTCTDITQHNDLIVVFCAPGDAIDNLSDDDRLVLQAVSSELVVAVENSQLYKLTKKLSITDELTGLYNYRFLQQRLEQEWERANRYNRFLSLLMLDVDHFKDYNDAHGHLSGDKALAELAGIIQASVREVDMAARYGGEEFAVLLPETDAAGAFVTAEKIREAVAEHKFTDDEGIPTQMLTLSVGVATFPVHAVNREDILRQADDALYQAKHFGRDRVRAPRIVNVDTDVQ